jgi:hypothetical protein
MKPGAAYTHKEEWWAGFEKVNVSTIAAASEFVAGKFSRK